MARLRNLVNVNRTLTKDERRLLFVVLVFSKRSVELGWAAAMRSPFKRYVEKLIEAERKKRAAKR
jgi:endonuclease YncB( thermonuclease family)